MKEYLDQPKQDTEKEEDAAKHIKAGSEELFRKSPEKELEELMSSSLHDVSEGVFKHMNPLGLDMASLKEKLEQEAEELETLIEEVEKIHPDFNKELIDESKKELVAKKFRIEQINDYLLGKDVVDLEKLKSNLN